MSVFYGKWDAGYHQYHFVGTGFGILLKAAIKFGGIVIETVFSEKIALLFSWFVL